MVTCFFFFFFDDLSGHLHPFTFLIFLNFVFVCAVFIQSYILSCMQLS